MLKKSICLILMIAALSIGLAVRSGDVAADTNVLANKDSFLRGWWFRNLNEGANTRLVVQKFGKKRTVLSFDISGISTPQGTVWLEMTVASKARYWGSNGRYVEVRRLCGFTEGGGSVWGLSWSAKDLGTGVGVTYNCASDADISNRKKDCGSSWRGGSKCMSNSAADSVLHSNDLDDGDKVLWNVTNDVIAAKGEGKSEINFVVMKSREGKWGKVVYYSKEGADDESDPDKAPKLIVENTAPEITSDGGLATASINIAENQTAVTDVQSTDDSDSEGAGLVYSISGGADQSLFTINAIGMLTFITAPDFETPTDAGINNVYDVQVTVTDSGGLTDVQDIAVMVTDVPTVLARAYINADRQPGYDPGSDIMIAQLVDTDGSNGVNIGDTVEFGSCPTSFDPCPTIGQPCTNTTNLTGPSITVTDVWNADTHLVLVKAGTARLDWQTGVSEFYQDKEGTDQTALADGPGGEDWMRVMPLSPSAPLISIPRTEDTGPDDDDYFLDVEIGILE